MSYTAKAFNTADGQKTLNDMAQRNGRDLDGTAIIASVSEIDNLFSNGYITKTTRPLSDPLRYSICPVIKDPRDGGIALDQFLAITRKPNGTALEPEFLKKFRESPVDWRTGELIEHSGRSPQRGRGRFWGSGSGFSISARREITGTSAQIRSDCSLKTSRDRRQRVRGIARLSLHGVAVKCLRGSNNPRILARAQMVTKRISSLPDCDACKAKAFCIGSQRGNDAFD